MAGIEMAFLESWDGWDDGGPMVIFLYNVKLKDGILPELEQREWPSFTFDGENSKISIHDDDGNTITEKNISAVIVG